MGIKIKNEYYDFNEIKKQLPAKLKNNKILTNPQLFRFQEDIITIFQELHEKIKHIDMQKINPIKNNINFLPPSPYASKIICLGLNYSDHANEVQRPTPKKPNLFAKGTNALIGHKENIILPKISKAVDYEAELAIIIGKKGKNIAAKAAQEYILGYTIMNDITARDLEFEEGIQWFRSKSFDTFAPMGPFLLVDNQINPNNLDIKLWVNNELRQNSNTNKMVNKCEEIIEFISTDTTLLPGDIISTGTPPGIGMMRKPKPEYLKKGDTLKIKIERIGELVNKIK
ncbi:MAG: fumarylacetoacetate hydrolase family protein [Candidatus Odinarchaeia archaeon]